MSPRALRSRPGEGELSALAQRLGVPGIPVEGTDAVGIYRATQESIGRARAGGGAALLECIPFRPAGEPARVAPDPLDALENSLLARGAATPAWVHAVHQTAARRLSLRDGKRDS